MAMRRCVICRTTRPSSSLLRLGLDADGRLSPSTGRNGRSAWVCLASRCLSGLAARPSRAAASLKRPVQGTSDIQKLARDQIWTQVLACISRCMASGLILSGRKALAEAAPEIFVAEICSDSRTERARTTPNPRFLGCSRFFLPMDSATLGAAIGRGPRSVLGIFPGKPSLLLIAQLRLLVEVG